MICPNCLTQTKILDSRLTYENKATRRRHLCAKCEYRFTTIETIFRNDEIRENRKLDIINQLESLIKQIQTFNSN